MKRDSEACAKDGHNPIEPPPAAMVAAPLPPFGRRPTQVVGTKFNADGTVREFPGNTIACKLAPLSEAMAEFQWVREQLCICSAASNLGFLPPSSLHMTVFELLCDQVRSPSRWSQFLPLDLSLEEIDRFMDARFRCLRLPNAIHVSYAAIELGTAIVARLEPSEADRKMLSQLRDNASMLTGIRFPDHDSYQLHVTMAYLLFELAPAQKRDLAETIRSIDRRLRRSLTAITMGTPQLLFFNDMAAFDSGRIKRRPNAGAQPAREAK